MGLVQGAFNKKLGFWERATNIQIKEPSGIFLFTPTRLCGLSEKVPQGVVQGLLNWFRVWESGK